MRWNKHDELIGMVARNHLFGVQLTALKGNIQENRVSFERFTVRQCKERSETSSRCGTGHDPSLNKQPWRLAQRSTELRLHPRKIG